MPMSRKLAAEFIGTFWLVLGGCGSAVLAAAFPGLGIGFAGVALAFGLTVLTMAFAIGHISGCHLNPAVTLGLWAGGRHPTGEVLPYVAAQVLGGIAGAGMLYMIASGNPAFDVAGGMASNGYGAHSPGGYSAACRFPDRGRDDDDVPRHHPGFDRQAGAGGSRTDRHRPRAHADPPDQHPVTNTSVNPARSTGPALFVGGWAIDQLWMFWIAPLLGALIAGYLYRWLADSK